MYEQNKNLLQKISAEQKRKESDSNVIPNNSFEYLYRDYLIKTYELNKKKCIKIISNLTSIRKKLAKIYGKTTIYNLISKPHMTMCFKNNFFYQKIYPLLLNWWKCSNVTALEKNDIPLENIAKLYEYLCLFKIFDAINSVLNITPLKHDSTLLLKSKQYIWTLEQGETITLFYEPISVKYLNILSIFTFENLASKIQKVSYPLLQYFITKSGV